MVVEARVLLTNLRAAATEALAQARQEKVDGDIGWDTLSCVRAEKFIADNRDGGYRCFIKDAAPDCDELQAYVTAHVFGKMGVSIEVITNWNNEWPT